MQGRAGRKAFIALLLLAGGAVLAASSVAQMIDPKQDPRNDKYWEAIDAACMGHHIGEMADAFRIVLLTNYAGIPVNEPVQFEVEIRDENPNAFPLQVYDIGGTLDLGNATNVQFVTEGRDPAITTTPLEASVNPDTARVTRTEFTVEENVTEIRILLDGTGSPLDQVPGGGEVWELAVYPFSNQANRREGQGTPEDKSIKFTDQLDIYSRGLGKWIAEATYRGNGPDATAELTTEVYYNTTAQSKMTVTGIDSEGKPAVIRDQERAYLTWTIMATEPGPALLDFTFFARDHFDHPQGLAAQNDGHFLRFYAHKMVVGPEGSSIDFQTSTGVAAPQPIASVNVYNLVGRITGFIAAIVVPITMVTGGVLGKGSRKSVNVLTGGAKKRVLWHASMSFIIIGIVALHLILMLVEPSFKWSKGFLWGMAGLVFMATLGVSGYYQVRIIKRWNYRTWRFMHLSAGVFVFLTMLVHTVVDGSDFQFFRDDFPSLNRFIWP